MGATSGIGMHLALALARRGWTVGIAGRRAERLRQVESMENNIVCSRVIDVCDENAPRILMQMAEEMGGVELYCHSSGIGWQNTQLDCGKELDTVDTNALGFTRMVTAVFNMFAARTPDNGRCMRIACISSIAGTKGLGAAPAYSATKRFQNSYLEALTQLARIRRLPIRITDIRPGFVNTALIAGSGFPMLMPPEKVARDMVRAIEKDRSVLVVDWRYALLVALWRMLPRWLWVRLRLHKTYPPPNRSLGRYDDNNFYFWTDVFLF